jgi:uncharacterized membrane protein
MGHSHHPYAEIRVPPRTHRLLILAVMPFVVATVIGLVGLWPSERAVKLQGGPVDVTEVKASVTDTSRKPCPDAPGLERFACSRVEVEIGEGEDEGDTFSFDYSTGPRTRSIRRGDDVILGRTDQQQVELAPGAPEPPKYFFVDFDRGVPLLALAVTFSAVVIALSRWRGLAALGGLVVSLLVLVKFVLPAILEGSQPLLVAIVGGATIMLLALYLAHGLNATTTTAVLGTLASLFLTGALAALFVHFSSFTGAGSEEATLLQINQQQVNLQGLLLASIIIGTLGVLDDVTVTQASAVWELRKANPDLAVRKLYQAGLRIGRDHIASTVNTLVLAYAGASLPLLILFSVSNRSWGQVVATQTVAEEVVRTLVGSIGLVAAVPITTGLAALVVTGSGPHRDRAGGLGVRRNKAEDAYLPPRAERDFWSD